MRGHVTARERRDRREREGPFGEGGIERRGHAPRPKLPPLEEPTRARDGGPRTRRPGGERREGFDRDRGQGDLRHLRLPGAPFMRPGHANRRLEHPGRAVERRAIAACVRRDRRPRCPRFALEPEEARSPERLGRARPERGDDLRRVPRRSLERIVRRRSPRAPFRAEPPPCTRARSSPQRSLARRASRGPTRRGARDALPSRATPAPARRPPRSRAPPPRALGRRRRRDRGASGRRR